MITVTVSVSANSNLCALDYELRYKSSDFEVVSGSQSLKGVFGYEAAKDNVMSSGNNAFKYSGATSGKVSNSAATLFTVKLKAKTTSGKITAVVTGAYTSSGDSDYTDVTSAVAAASAKNIVFSGKCTEFRRCHGKDLFIVKALFRCHAVGQIIIGIFIKAQFKTAEYQQSAFLPEFRRLTDGVKIGFMVIFSAVVKKPLSGNGVEVIGYNNGIETCLTVQINDFRR